MASGASISVRSEGETLVVRDKARGDVLAELPIDDARAVAAAVDRARAAQPAWGALAVRERARLCGGPGASWCATAPRSWTSTARRGRRAGTPWAS
jgi:hypothetical protein